MMDYKRAEPFVRAESQASPMKDAPLPPDNEIVQPVAIAQSEQVKQQLKATRQEVIELKQSLRYVEIQLAKQREETESVENKLKD